MKNLTIVTLLVAISSGTSFASSTQLSKHDAAHHSINSSKISSVNPNVRFVTEMIPHHTSAVMMSEKELPKITDPQIKKLAEDIIVAQKKEIQFMKQWLDSQENSSK